MTYSKCFGIIIPDKTTIRVVSWHQMDTRLTRFVLDTRLLFETRLVLEALYYVSRIAIKGHVRRKNYIPNVVLSEPRRIDIEQKFTHKLENCCNVTSKVSEITVGWNYWPTIGIHYDTYPSSIHCTSSKEATGGIYTKLE